MGSLDQDVDKIVSRFNAVGMVSIGARLALEQKTEESRRYLQMAVDIDPAVELNWVEPGVSSDPETAAVAIASQVEYVRENNASVTVDDMIASLWPPNIVSNNHMIARSANLIILGVEPIREDEIDRAVEAFEDALIRNPDIDLYPRTPAKEQDAIQAVELYLNPPDIEESLDSESAEAGLTESESTAEDSTD